MNASIIANIRYDENIQLLIKYSKVIRYISIALNVKMIIGSALGILMLPTTNKHKKSSSITIYGYLCDGPMLIMVAICLWIFMQ
jgi:hypothetical protein